MSAPLDTFDAAVVKLRSQLERELRAGLRFGSASLEVTVQDGGVVAAEHAVAYVLKPKDLHTAPGK